MRKLFVSIALAALCLCSCDHSKDLVIIHFNDTHSHLDPMRSGDGGVIERTAFVDSMRMARGVDNVLLVHAGDFSQGSSYFTILKGDLEIDLINAMGYDCVTLGNHEFDNGIEELGRRVGNLRCPCVCANYDFSPFEAGRYITPFAIVRKAGMNIGIVGILCDISSVVDRNTADRIPVLGTYEEVANKWASYLKNEAKCDMVLVLSHAGYKEDMAAVPSLHNVDAVIGGHSHTRLDEMTVCQDADGRDVPVVQNWCWGYEAGVLELAD
ncbi:MAG: metallophosphatase [Bacteroidales bacterium]|nr:metallophosphatase [Candidatus Cryptobacteroides onthequi]